MSSDTPDERSEEGVVQQRLVRHLESCKYWHGVSECECNSHLQSGGCLHCDMDEAVGLLAQIIQANAKMSDASEASSLNPKEPS